MNDNICAISTALGAGAISIIRISGNDAIEIVNSIFSGKDLTKVESHTIHYGFIVDNSEKIDEVLVTIMKAPKTYTMEDIVEINTHGSIATTNRVLELILTKNCRLAEGGEFTKRAFLNGRIDLIQAEAVGDLIQTSTENSRKMLLGQLTGNLSTIIKRLRKKIVSLLANLAVNMDYPEYEDAEDITHDILNKELRVILDELNKILATAKDGKIIKDGVNIALIGRPNVGKSSLLNKFLDENKAIVTSIAGTTRDIVEGSILLNGIKFNFVDTAGIRKTDDEVEKIGVEKSKKIIQDVDLIICLLNGSEELSLEDKEILDFVKNYPHIIFVNKNDQELKINIDKLSNNKIIYGNTVEENGIDNLKKLLIEEFNLNNINSKDFTYVSNARQLALLKNAYSILENVLNIINEEIPVDILEIDIKRVYDILGEITGETYKDELLDELFSNFCLGK